MALLKGAATFAKQKFCPGPSGRPAPKLGSSPEKAATLQEDRSSFDIGDLRKAESDDETDDRVTESPAQRLVDVLETAATGREESSIDNAASSAWLFEHFESRNSDNSDAFAS
ncbi:hypothetical protein [Methylosinus sp. PW1]|uniref:hypothetical protein n=1 Tax=Methylosinus sp. PW1 TaxID=107636 RepID=UPI0012EBD307|nr:hypothetical protein [Methylosinus sp. PW1]